MVVDVDGLVICVGAFVVDAPVWHHLLRRLDGVPAMGAGLARSPANNAAINGWPGLYNLDLA